MGELAISLSAIAPDGARLWQQSAPLDRLAAESRNGNSLRLEGRFFCPVWANPTEIQGFGKFF